MLSFQAGDVLAQLRALALQRCHFALRRRACAHTHSVLSNNSAYTYRLFPRMLTREPARGSSTSPLLRMLACALVNSATHGHGSHLCQRPPLVGVIQLSLKLATFVAVRSFFSLALT
jgi:hypothetical protein